MPAWSKTSVSGFFVLPLDAEESMEAAQVKSVELFGMSTIDSPGITCIDESGQDLQLGNESESPQFPDNVTESSKGGDNLGNPVVDFCIDVHHSWECAAQIREDVDRPKFLSPHHNVWILVGLSWHGLVHDFSLLCTYGETEDVVGSWKAVYFLLHLLLYAGIEGTVVSKQKFSDDGLLHLADSFQAPEVEQSTVSFVPNV